jgi:tRNA threonylcarbamoyladenosine modification (KEOPS) complex  Pcc1 subunit
MIASKKTHLEKKKVRQRINNHKSLSEITIEIDFGSTKIADTVYDSVFPETKQPRSFRSNTTLSRKNKVLRLTIKSKDLVALRAASSAFLRFVCAALKTINTVAPFYSAESAGRPIDRKDRLD